VAATNKARSSFVEDYGNITENSSESPKLALTQPGVLFSNVDNIYLLGS